MLWIWFFLVTTKELFLKIAAPKRQVKSMKTTCEVISFYYICNQYTWNLWKEILHKHFSRVLLRLLVMSFLKKRKNNKTDIDFLNFILIITWTISNFCCGNSYFYTKGVWNIMGKMSPKVHGKDSFKLVRLIPIRSVLKSFNFCKLLNLIKIISHGFPTSSYFHFQVLNPASPK